MLCSAVSHVPRLIRSWCYFRKTLTYLITVHERNRQTDRQTDRQDYCYPVYTIQPVVNPVVSCTVDNRLCRVNKYPTNIQPVVKQPVWQPPLFVQPVVKPGRTTRLTTGCIHDTAVCQTGCQTGLTTGWMFVYTIQPVVNPVWQPIWQWVWQLVVSCIQTFTRLSNLFDNRFDNRLYRVNGAYGNTGLCTKVHRAVKTETCTTAVVLEYVNKWIENGGVTIHRLCEKYFKPLLTDSSLEYLEALHQPSICRFCLFY